MVMKHAAPNWSRNYANASRFQTNTGNWPAWLPATIWIVIVSFKQNRRHFSRNWMHLTHFADRNVLNNSCWLAWPTPGDRLLDLKPGASKDDVKKAFKELAKEYHPDLGGDAEIFQAMRAAHDRIVKGS